MAQNVFDPNKKYVCSLRYGIHNQPRLVGHLAADTVESGLRPFRNTEYAVFTVDEPTESRSFPPEWVGTYRLPMAAMDWYIGELQDDGTLINKSGDILHGLGFERYA